MNLKKDRRYKITLILGVISIALPILLLGVLPVIRYLVAA